MRNKSQLEEDEANEFLRRSYNLTVGYQKFMKQQHLPLLSIILILFMSLQIKHIRADQEAPPYDYAIITPDEKFIFVMLIPDETIMESWEFHGHEPTYYDTRIFQTEISDDQWLHSKQDPYSLRTNYPCSGLYKNNGSSKPIWTVDWYSHHVYLYPDAEHLIRWGPWNRIESDENGERSFDGLAFALYKNGVEIADYLVKDVIKDTNAIHYSVSHYRWKTDSYVDKSTGILHIGTFDNQKLSYDVLKIGETVYGREISCKTNYRFSAYAKYRPLIAISAILFSILIFISIQFRQRSHSKKSAISPDK